MFKTRDVWFDLPKKGVFLKLLSLIVHEDIQYYSAEMKMLVSDFHKFVIPCVS